MQKRQHTLGKGAKGPLWDPKNAAGQNCVVICKAKYDYNWANASRTPAACGTPRTACASRHVRA
jgi:hypothetical protein